MLQDAIEPALPDAIAAAPAPSDDGPLELRLKHERAGRPGARCGLVMSHHERLPA